MTSKEFEVFLKKIKGLENGYGAAPKNNKRRYRLFQFFKGLGFNDYNNPFRSKIYSRHFFSFGDGWLDITASLIRDLIDLGWNKQICDAKQKFGGGRFYINEGSKQIHERISKWEKETFKTCEECGKEGTIRNSSWQATLCDKCHN